MSTSARRSQPSQIDIEPATARDIEACARLFVAQEARWNTLDPRLRPALTLAEASAQLAHDRLAGGRPPLVARDPSGRVCGSAYATLLAFTGEVGQAWMLNVGVVSAPRARAHGARRMS